MIANTSVVHGFASRICKVDGTIQIGMAGHLYAFVVEPVGLPVPEIADASVVVAGGEDSHLRVPTFCVGDAGIS